MGTFVARRTSELGNWRIAQNMKALGLQLGWPPLAGITLNDFLMFCTCARAMGTVLSVGLHEGASGED
jgi:hypothetical protein